VRGVGGEKRREGGGEGEGVGEAVGLEGAGRAKRQLRLAHGST